MTEIATRPIPIKTVPIIIYVNLHPKVAIITVVIDVKPSLKDSATANKAIAVVYLSIGK